MTSNIIAVIGATGAQGLPAVKHLLASKDGKQSPWKVRALTRDTTHRRAVELKALGVELVEGSFEDIGAIEKLFDGAYGAFVNTDTFTVGAAREMQAAFVIWETAKKQQLRHFVWSSIDYAMRLGNYDPIYRHVDHLNTKGRFSDFLASQESLADKPTGTIWTVLTTGPYLDMLSVVFAPFNVRKDGTRVFSFPIGDEGRIPLIALDDIGWWVRHIVDSPSKTSAKNIGISSEIATGQEIVQAFKNATGLPAVYKPLSMDDYFELWDNRDVPAASSLQGGTTWQQLFRGLFAVWRDNIVTRNRDMEWVKSVHAPTTMEQWIKDEKYTGDMNYLLKNVEDGKGGVSHNVEKCSQL